MLSRIKRIKRQQTGFFIFTRGSSKKYQFTVLILLILLIKTTFYNGASLFLIMEKIRPAKGIQGIVTILVTNQGEKRKGIAGADHCYTTIKTMADSSVGGNECHLKKDGDKIMSATSKRE